MQRSVAARFTGALVLAAGLTLAAMQPAAANHSALSPSGSPQDAPKVTAAMSAAMQRDLHLTPEQVQARLGQEEAAMRAEQTARTALGSAYAGSWFDSVSGKLVVHTTDSAKADAVRSEVATVSVVANSSAALDAVKSDLDAMAGKAAPAAVNGWYVDVRTNSVVVSVNPTTMDAAAKGFVARATALHDSVRVIEDNQSPRTFADIVGAYPYWINGAGRCSIGFTVTTGFVTAGHCGTPGSSATDGSGALLGYFQGSSFPGNDYAYVGAAGGAYLYGYVYGYDGYYYYVRGSAEYPEGSSICRSGSTTGMWCGTIQSKNQTVNYPQGTVFGLTRTTVCAEPGDSGGSWITANQAQGVTSGGSGNCSSGGTTFFQPVNEILNTYGLSLVLT